jgi:sulfotransferase family protein
VAQEGKGRGSTSLPTGSFVGRVRGFGTRKIARATTSPFASRSERPIIVHCSHHKAGTVWFIMVLVTLTRPYGMRLQRVPPSGRVLPKSDVLFYGNAEVFDPEQLDGRPFRGSHIVRDPRDMVVSGYEYHLTTKKEAWLLEPNPAFGGRSYQDHLRQLPEHDGLMTEIAWMAESAGRAMGEWDYDRPEFLELHYEDALADERGTFEGLLRWYGLNDAAVERGLAAVDQLSLRNGGAGKAHARSGQPGEWRSRLSADHIASFKELTGDLVVRLGYERDTNW